VSTKCYNENYNWDKLIPKYYSVETIWAESGISSARDFERFDLVEKFNKKKFDIVSLAKNKSIKKIIYRELKVKNLFKKIILFCRSKLYNYLNFINRGFQKVFLKKTKVYRNIKNITDALKLLK